MTWSPLETMATTPGTFFCSTAFRRTCSICLPLDFAEALEALAAQILGTTAAAKTARRVIRVTLAPSNRGFFLGKAFILGPPCRASHVFAEKSRRTKWKREEGELARAGQLGVDVHKERTVPIPPSAAAALRGWLEVRGNEAGPLLCPVKAGRVTIRRMTAQALMTAILRRGAEANVPHLSPHDLRRSYLTSLLRAGADLSTVQRLAGHANVTTT